jgi:hypothetical protein
MEGETLTQVRQEAACRHHWLIEAPRGRVSLGVCRLCGKVKEFKNYIEGSAWGEGGDAEGAKWEGFASLVPYRYEDSEEE